jgi:hypothetical protein
MSTNQVATRNAPAPGWHAIDFGPERILVLVLRVREVEVGLRAHEGQVETRVEWRRVGSRLKAAMRLNEWNARQPAPASPPDLHGDPS